jgi:hypothetical protein
MGWGAGSAGKVPEQGDYRTSGLAKPVQAPSGAGGTRGFFRRYDIPARRRNGNKSKSF